MAEANKFQEALSKYNTELNDADVTKAVNDILAKKFKENDNKEVYKKLYNSIDLTTLNTTDTKDSVYKFVQAVNDFDGSTDCPNVAAICVHPNFAGLVKDTLTADNVNIAAVTGCFPTAQTFIEVKVAETALTVAAGANEIDIVLNVGEFYEGNYQEVCEEIMEQKAACKDAHLKVILETGALKNASDVKKASILSLYSGADFIKTSTGKVYPGASLESAYVMCSAIKEYFLETGVKAGFKASGGIRTTEEAVKYYTIFKEILGEEFLSNRYFRIGASSLAGDLLKNIE